MSTTTKNAKKSGKLIDLVKNKSENQEEFAITSSVEQSKINSQQEILGVKKMINEQDTIIQKTLLSTDFSLSKLYEAETTLILLNKKLVWMEARFTELF